MILYDLPMEKTAEKLKIPGIALLMLRQCKGNTKDSCNTKEDRYV